MQKLLIERVINVSLHFLAERNVRNIMRKGKERKRKGKERRNVWPDRETSREAGTTDTER